MKTIIYIRTSTQEQNPENQLADCISINDYGEYEVVEEKQSAYKDSKRSKFEKIKQQIKTNTIQHLICWDLDRLYRNRKKLIQFFELCKMYNCKIHSYRQEWLEQLHKIPEPFNDIMHALMLNLMGWLAEDESKKKSDRISRAVRRKDGVTKSYKGNKWGRKPKKVDYELITELHSKGLSTYKIAAEYNKVHRPHISHVLIYNYLKKNIIKKSLNKKDS